jgi:hypothetical protein
MNYAAAWMIGAPLSTALFSTYIYLKLLKRSGEIKNRFRQLLHSILSYIIFLIFLVVGELMGHLINPSIYSRLGDNPTQIAGLFLSFFISLFIFPLILFRFWKQQAGQEGGNKLPPHLSFKLFLNK